MAPPDGAPLGRDGGGIPTLVRGARLPGTPYELVERWSDAAGGSETWRARRADSGAECLVEILLPGHPHRESIARRLARAESEGRLGGRGSNAMAPGFRSARIADVLDASVTDDGRPYFALEALRGHTLRAELDARGPLPPARAVAVAMAALEGLDAAHGVGAVHRDVAPERIVLLDDGGVKLTGLGKVLDARAGGAISPVPERGRRGSPYAAPEITAGVADPRSDVFSMGVVLYEALVGKRPFARVPSSPSTPVAAPSVAAGSDLPAELDEAVLGAMAIDPARRPASAAALFAGLARVHARLVGPGAIVARPADGDTMWASERGKAIAGGRTGVLALASTPDAEPANVYGVAPGTVLAGKYRVVRILGRGGMGIVVEAKHLQLDTRVALKFLLPEFMSYAEASGRFLREARAASRLSSVHVARVLDDGTLEGGEPYMVMEYLSGEDLAYHAHGGNPMPIGETIEYVAQACDAIAEAHGLGIIHRDLKPANLFLTKRADGAPLVKVLDFGISKVVGGDETRDVSLTQTTTILGSALYMAPEQMKSSKNVDRRSDVYSLGVCLFELLGREQPFFAETFPELCAKVYTSSPKSLRALRPDVPDGLERAIERALAREPDDRYSSVGALLVALSPWARLDTRTRIEAILRQHDPLLALLPPAAPAKPSARAPVGDGPSAAASAPPRRLLGAALLLATVAVAAVAGWRYAGRPGGATAAGVDAAAVARAPAPAACVTPAASSSAEAAPSAAPVASAAPSASSTPATSAPPVASALPVASAAPVASAPKNAPAPPPVAAATRPPVVAAPKPREVEPPPAGASPPSRELVQETCRATMPDGTVKIVPCP